MILLGLQNGFTTVGTCLGLSFLYTLFADLYISIIGGNAVITVDYFSSFFFFFFQKMLKNAVGTCKDDLS